MTRRWMVAVAVLAIVVISAIASAELGIWPFGAAHSSCPSGAQRQCFYQQPVVDIILPIIGTSGNSTNPNRLVNMTVGSSASLEVDIYPTVPLNVSMTFSSYLLSSGTTVAKTGSGSPSASFVPEQLSIIANGRGVTDMRLAIPQNVEPGEYAAVITAIDRSNSSLSWGLYFELNLT